MTVLILSLVLAFASASDVLTHRIPNRLCLVALSAGLGSQALAAEPASALAMAASVVVPLLLLLPFYAGGGMAAGDVKLMASCGALLGWPDALLATGCALVFGTLMGVIVYLRRGGWRRFAARYGTALRMLCLTGSVCLRPAAEDPVAGSRFPYALAIAAGCLTSAALSAA